MEIAVVLFLVVCGIGALIIGGIGIVAFISWWWIALPLICALIGGWIGFLFGVGLVVVIGFFILIAQSSGSETSNAASVSQPVKKVESQITHTDHRPPGTKNNIQTVGGESFILCLSCNERNNPTFSKCWKCGQGLD